MKEDISLKIWFSCLRKKSFSKEAADTVVDIKMRQGIVFYYYKCPLCRAYHLTSRPPKKNDNNINVV